MFAKFSFANKWSGMKKLQTLKNWKWINATKSWIIISVSWVPHPQNETNKQTLSSISWYSFPFSTMILNNNLNFCWNWMPAKAKSSISSSHCWWTILIDIESCVPEAFFSDDIVPSCISINLQILGNVHDFHKSNDASHLLHF